MKKRIRMAKSMEEVIGLGLKRLEIGEEEQGSGDGEGEVEGVDIDDDDNDDELGLCTSSSVENCFCE